MRRNVSFNSTAVEQANSTSEYKIGNTTYIVELHFTFDFKETLDDIIERLVANNLENAAYFFLRIMQFITSKY